jgi:glutamine synthetase
MDHAEHLQWLNEQTDIENIFACICDLNGTLRGKRLDVAQASKILEGSVRMPLSLAGLDIWGEDIEVSALVFETGDADGDQLDIAAHRADPAELVQ